MSGGESFQADLKVIPTLGDFSVEFWVIVSKSSEGYIEFLSQGNHPEPFYFGLDPSSKIRVGDSWVDTGAAVAKGKWVHLALTHSLTGQSVIYVDGTEVAAKAGVRLNGGTTSTRIGAQFSGPIDETFAGCLDDLAIWSAVRSPSEIAASAKGTTDFRGEALTAFYDFTSAASPNDLAPTSGGAGGAAVFHATKTVSLRDRSDPLRGVVRFNSGALDDRLVTDGFPSYYVNSAVSAIPQGFRTGFGWYSTLWPLTDTVIEGMQVGLGSTWIVPDNSSLPDSTAEKVCRNGPAWAQNASANSGSYGFYLMQTIEGSLGWWAGEQFKSVMPKYMINVTGNCYSTAQSGPGRTFFSEAVQANDTGTIQISNQILIPPDGMTFEQDFTGPQLGVTWASLPLPTFDHAYSNMAGDNSWTLFINAKNFKGPLIFVAPQFWSDGVATNPIQKGLGLDANDGLVGGLTSEWAQIPYYKYKDQSGVIYTKIPRLQFPVNGNGNFAISRDFSAYSSGAVGKSFADALNSGASLPQSVPSQSVYTATMSASSTGAYQDGKTLGNFSRLLAVQPLESNRAYGFSFGGAERLERLPQYFKQVGNKRVAISEAEAPLALVQASFGGATQTSGFIYGEPGWWSTSKAASADIKSTLHDGSEVVYRWYKFVDQPALQRFKLTAPERSALQAAAEKMQRDWANFSIMSPPTSGKLAAFDSGLMVTPPKGLEIGYVPIVVRQSAVK